MQIKATVILSALAAFASTAAAHDGHGSSAHGTYVTATTAWGSSSSDYPSSWTTKSSYGGNYTSGYNATATGSSTKLYSTTKAPFSSKPAPTTPTTLASSPSPTAGASRSEFAMAVLGLAVAAGLMV